MEDILTTWLNKLYRKSHKLYVFAYVMAGVLLFGLLGVIIGISIWSYVKEGQSGLSIFGEIFVNTIASIVGVLLAYLLYRFLFLVSHRNEDKNKVSYANRDMWKQYGTHYRQQFTLHGDHVCTVYCEKLLQNKKGLKIHVTDHPSEFFELDSFIKTQFFDLIQAHAMSETTNSITVRLKEVVEAEKGNEVTIHTMRSTYLSHMLTNRALDYDLKGGVTIRSLFENTDRLIPPQRSRMSNHFGVNALVFLKDKKTGNQTEWLLLPERGGSATVAKNKVTASIATRLKMKDYTKELPDKAIMRGGIDESIADSIRVTTLPKSKYKVEFLGLSRDIYEGGKPTLFYVVYLDMCKDEYDAARKAYEEDKAKKNAFKRAQTAKGFLPEKEETIDEVVKIHVAKWTSVMMSEPCAKEKEVIDEHAAKQADKKKEEYYNIAYDNAPLEFEADGVTEHKAFEQNLIANFWFYLGCKGIK